MLHFAHVLRACCDHIDTRGINACVAEDIGKAYDVLFDAVEGAREQVPQIVRKDLTWQHVCLLAKAFHHAPYVMPADRVAVSCDKDASLLNALRFCVLSELFLQG